MHVRKWIQTRSSACDWFSDRLMDSFCDWWWALSHPRAFPSISNQNVITESSVLTHMWGVSLHPEASVYRKRSSVLVWHDHEYQYLFVIFFFICIWAQANHQTKSTQDQVSSLSALLRDSGSINEHCLENGWLEVTLGTLGFHFTVYYLRVRLRSCLLLRTNLLNWFISQEKNKHRQNYKHNLPPLPRIGDLMQTVQIWNQARVTREPHGDTRGCLSISQRNPTC